MNAYHKREAARRERMIAEAARRRSERHASALEHADAVIRRYADAHRTFFGPEAVPANVTFDPSTGWYTLHMANTNQKMREQALTDAADFLYARAHALQIEDTSDGD